MICVYNQGQCTRNLYELYTKCIRLINIIILNVELWMNKWNYKRLVVCKSDLYARIWRCNDIGVRDRRGKWERRVRINIISNTKWQRQRRNEDETVSYTHLDVYKRQLHGYIQNLVSCYTHIPKQYGIK